jgi:hypothetical protein
LIEAPLREGPGDGYGVQLNGSYGHLEGGGVNRCYSNFNSFLI